MENNSVESVQSQFVAEEGGATASSIPVELEEKMGELNLENNIRPQIKNINTDAENTNTNGIPETAPQQQGLFHPQQQLQQYVYTRNSKNRIPETTVQQQGLFHQQQLQQYKRRLPRRQQYVDNRNRIPETTVQQQHSGLFHPWRPQQQQYYRHHLAHQRPQGQFQRQQYRGHPHPQQQRYHGHLSVAGVCMMNRPNQNEINRNHALVISNHSRQQLLQQRRSIAPDNPPTHTDNNNAHQ